MIARLAGYAPTRCATHPRCSACSSTHGCHGRNRATRRSGLPGRRPLASSPSSETARSSAASPLAWTPHPFGLRQGQRSRRSDGCAQTRRVHAGSPLSSRRLASWLWDGRTHQHAGQASTPPGTRHAWGGRPCSSHAGLTHVRRHRPRERHLEHEHVPLPAQAGARVSHSHEPSTATSDDPLPACLDALSAAGASCFSPCARSPTCHHACRASHCFSSLETWPCMSSQGVCKTLTGPPQIRLP